METIRSGTTKTSSLFLKVYIEIALGFFFFFSLIIISCKKEKDEVPSLTTAEVTSVNRTSAICGGEVTYEGTSGVISKGVCWSTSDNPTTDDSLTVDGSGPGSFTSNITGLDPGTAYYIRAYATNSTVTGYGETKSFTTDPASIPEVTTSGVTSITRTTATSGGTLTSDGASQITDCGICWNTEEDPTLLDNYISIDSGLNTFSIIAKGLEPNINYYIRAYVTNLVGTGYGNNKQFTTLLPDNSFDPSSLIGTWEMIYSYGGVSGLDYSTPGCTYIREFTKDSLMIDTYNGSIISEKEFYVYGNILAVNLIEYIFEISNDTLSLVPYNFVFEGYKAFFKRLY